MIDLSGIPTWATVTVVVVLTAAVVIGIPLARVGGRRAGERSGGHLRDESRGKRAQSTIIMISALVPTVLVWAAVMGVSFVGLTGFAADVMKWDNWTNMLVPLSLDGISISFGAWAFAAVKRGRHPGRAYKIVLAAATVSATLNFVHGQNKWSIWAGLYLGFLSMVGMAMFHELLDQFMAGYDDEIALKTTYPRFGQRWIYAPVSTFKARRAWIIWPPAEGARPTIQNALTHLRDIQKLTKQEAMDAIAERAEQKMFKAEQDQRVKEARGTRRSSPVRTGGTAAGEHNGAAPLPTGGSARVPTQVPHVNGTPAVPARQPVTRPVSVPPQMDGQSDLEAASAKARAIHLWIEQAKQGRQLKPKELLEAVDAGNGERWAQKVVKEAREILARELGEPVDEAEIEVATADRVTETVH